MQALPRDNCFQAYKKCLIKYIDFSGRARRSEYWYFQLLYYLALLIVMLPLLFIKDEENLKKAMNIVSLVYSLIFLLPKLSVTIRRIHDTGRSGCYFWMILIPIAGPFIMLYYFICDSQEETNEYGPSPKYIDMKENFLVNQNNTNYNNI